MGVKLRKEKKRREEKRKEYADVEKNGKERREESIVKTRKQD